MKLLRINRWLLRCIPCGGLPLFLTAAVFFLLLAAAVWWFMPLSPRATLLEGSEILRLSPDGRFLATRQRGQVTLWDVATGQAAGTLPGDLTGWPSWGFVFSADARWLAAGGEGTLKLWEVPTGRESVALPISADKKLRPRPTFSTDGKWLAFRAEGPDRAYQVKIWDLAEGRERGALAGRAGPLRFSPDSKTLAFESWEAETERPTVGLIRLWDIAGGKERPWFEKKPAPLRRLAFSPDGRTLATGEWKRRNWTGHHEVKLWDLDSGKSRGPWKLPRGVIGLSFTADGSRLVASSFAEAWELALIDPAAPPGDVTPLPLPRSLSVSLSADGRLLACSPNQPDAAATVVELPDCRERAPLQAPRSGERLFLQDFSPDNKLLAVVGGWTDAAPSRRFRLFGSKKAAAPAQNEFAELEGELHLYETDSGRRHGTVPVVRSARVWFTPDAKTLVVLAPGGTPTIWDLPLRTPWGRILVYWFLLAACCAGAGLWLRGRRKGGAAVN
jgi:hypothetical protein